ncbi:unnamed protein product, partial [Ilex paraguariensis]
TTQPLSVLSKPLLSVRRANKEKGGKQIFLALKLPAEIHPRKSASGRLLFPATSRKVVKLLAPSCLHKGIFSEKRSCQHSIMTPLRHSGELVSCHFNLISCGHTVIWGFWVGPDIEDGWGFVEAFVN